MLRNHWYPVLEAEKLKRKPIEIKRFGKKLALWRDASGSVRALPNACPHRGASLANGKVKEGELECPWHAFRFDGSGHCTVMPSEGPDAKIPRAMNVTPYTVREEHGLVFMWWGDAQETYPPIPYYEDTDERGTSQASYILPYHYSRMVETSLDFHHTPFVHGNVFPVGTRMVGFDAHSEGDRIYSSGTLVREKKAARGETEGAAFRADLILPNLGMVEISPRLKIVICATPVDEESSWLWFRYYQSYVGNALLGKLITWLSVESELRIVQKQDWRVFAGMTPGTVDDFPYAFVHSDKAIALYRKLRAERLAAEREGHPEQSTPLSGRAHREQPHAPTTGVH